MKNDGSSRTETWCEGVELLTIWFKKPLKNDGEYLTLKVRSFGGLIRQSQIRNYDEGKRKVEFKPCLVEKRGDDVSLSFPFPEKEFLALFTSPEIVVCPSVFGSCVAVSLPKSAILRIQKSGRRMFRERNPTCNWCTKESDRRAAIKLPSDTPEKDAEFVEDGKPYGIAYWGCNGCLKRLQKELNLQIFND